MACDVRDTRGLEEGVKRGHVIGSYKTGAYLDE